MPDFTDSTHVFLKFNETTPEFKNVQSTIFEHLNVYLKNNSVIWGHFSSRNIKDISDKRKAKLNTQLKEDKTTFVFLYNSKNKIFYVASLLGIYNQKGIVKHPNPKDYIPEYYHSKVGKTERTKPKELLPYIYFELTDLYPIELSEAQSIFLLDKNKKILEVGGMSTLMYVRLTKKFYDKLLNKVTEEKDRTKEILPEIENLEESYNVGSLSKVEAPDSKVNLKTKTNDESKRYNPIKRNYLEIQKKNSRVGLIGEKLVFEREKSVLKELGREDLASKVEHVSQTKGDGLGYDIESFTEAGEVKHIEVKTTTEGIESEFFIEESEVQYSRENPDKFYLYRVFSYDKESGNASLFTKKGNVEDTFKLEPKTYRAK
ncbi:DUF3883 domain-containing protein [Halobacillus sp. B29]|uniref:DUF3883 domain-containing protein n=1 Tax=Halobacillus sp. B29 TaxID=3457432 RepID=UPI003FCD3F12